MSFDRTLAVVLAITPILAIIGAIIQAVITTRGKGKPAPVQGVTVPAPDPELVADLREREQRAIRRADSYRYALRRANHALAEAGLETYDPDYY